MTTQTLQLGTKQFVVIEREDFDRLRAANIRAEELPPLPPADKHGNRPALEYARASLARKIILARRALGWSQGELARRTGVRVETINRIERGHNTPDIATVDRIDKLACAAGAGITAFARSSSTQVIQPRVTLARSILTAASVCVNFGFACFTRAQKVFRIRAAHRVGLKAAIASSSSALRRETRLARSHCRGHRGEFADLAGKLGNHQLGLACRFRPGW